MTDYERFEVALVRVKQGETIESVVASLFKNRWQYDQRLSKAQRQQLNGVRLEYLAARPVKKQQVAPRFYVETTADLRKAVEDHCRFQGITIRKFVNRAVANAMRKVKEES